MIPVRLKMRNFMCYRDNVPALDFTGIHLACISGDNGNGKSAIIDAMTWALWGKARAKNVDDLIHTTQAEMEVEFEFTIGEQLYRIIRKRSRPKKRTGAGQSSLEFQISSGNVFRPITGNTIDQTQQKIIEILHMDYDTFINSAYLRQGHADEFTRQDPAKRKEVLGNILGLAVYDELEDRAKELAKQHEADSTQLENAINEINAELAQKSSFETELEKAQDTLTSIDTAAREKESALNKFRQQKESLESRRAQLDEIETHILGTTRDLQRWEEQAAQHLSHIKEYAEIISRRSEIEAGYSRFAETKKTADEFDRKERQSHSLEKQKMQLESRIEKAKNELTTEHTLTQREISRLETLLKTLPELKNQLNQVQVQARKLAESEVILQQKEQAARELQSQVAFHEAGNARLAREIEEAEEKLDLIASHSAAHTEAKCPLCERELTKEGLELITAKYISEKQEKSSLLESNRADLSRKQTEYEAMIKEKLQFESALNQEKTRVHSQEELMKNKIKETEENNARAAELKKTVASIEQQLAKRDFAAAEQSALADMEKELDNLGYDPARHEQVRQELKQLEAYQREKNSLDEALRLIDQEKEAASRAEEAARGLRDSLEIDSRKKERLTAELTILPKVRQDLIEAEAEYKNISASRSQAQEAVGSIRAKLQRLAELETKKKEKENLMSQAAKEESIYRELSRAFGKGGIQALIIETALPEIEIEANRLLARMTDNRMHVKFETQKATKKGTVQETLDITIADELGTRNYEMFSGGEAFRINFAIRIALSRLLARRAGAPLPTLIIDEGFGTQDSTGMEKLKEAINSIQGDFEKILVITHMDELKDAFPTRIDVIKTADGSTISVN